MTENTAKNAKTLASSTPTACTIANFTKNRNLVCVAPTTMGNRMHDAALTSTAINPTRKSTATRLAKKMVRVEIGRGTRFM